MLVLLLWSRPVRVTVLAPMLAQVNTVWLRVKATMLQLSKLPLLTSATVRVACPAAFKLSVAFRHNMVGGMLSTTVTVP